MEKLSLFDIIFKRDEEDLSVEKGFFSREISGSMTKDFKRITSTRSFRLIKRLSYLIAHVSARVYGALLISLGIVSTLIYFLGISADNSTATPIIGIAFCCVSVPLLLTDKPLPILLQDFPVTDYLFFEFFCVKRHTVRENDRSIPIFAAIIVGIIPGVLSAFIPLWQIALAIGVIICVYVGMEAPEFIFLASLFALPYLRYIPSSEVWLCCAVAIAFISFIRKVMYGKRVLNIEQYDIFIGLMMLFVLISGIFVKGIESFSGSVRMIILCLGYVLAGNLITNRRLAERTVNSIVISGALASLTSIVQLIIVCVQPRLDGVEIDLSSILVRADGMSVFLITALVFSFGMIKQAQMPARVVYIVSAALCLSSIVLSGEFFALIAVILGLGVFAVMKLNKLAPVILPPLVFAPLLLLLLPNVLLDFLFSYSPSIVSAENLYELWGNSLQAFLNNFFVGIGIGSESFVEEMSAFGVFGHADSSNLLIELGLEAGAFALIFFLAILIIRLKHRSRHYLYVRNSQIEHSSLLSGTCLFCLLSFGMVNYIWSEISAYYLFWCVFGIGSATLRVAKKDYDDRVLYYEESSAMDSSVIDIEIG